MLEASSYIINGATHRYWWSWPFGADDKNYRVLRHVFADHTTNARSKGSAIWRGAYNEGTELHQVLGIFQNFSIYTRYEWLEFLLRKCGIAFEAPIIAASWQYELRGFDTRKGYKYQLHADIAMKILDSSADSTELVVVFEAKRKGGLLKPKDRDDFEGYHFLNHLKQFDRKHMILLIDNSDLNHPSYRGYPILSWQDLYLIQIEEVAHLGLSSDSTSYLTTKLDAYLRWFFTDDRSVANKRISRALSRDPVEECLPNRISSFLQGLDTVLRARLRRPLTNVPQWLMSEKSIEDYASSPAVAGEAFYEAVW